MLDPCQGLHGDGSEWSNRSVGDHVDGAPCGAVDADRNNANDTPDNQFLQSRRENEDKLCRRQATINAQIAFQGRPSKGPARRPAIRRSEEHTSELQSLMRISYAVFCLKKKKTRKNNTTKP